MQTPISAVDVDVIKNALINKIFCCFSETILSV